jgi:hypothetical protein
MNAPVTAYITSKDRYFTTLPSAILSIINQTVKPERFILFLDGEHLDLRNNDLYLGLFKMLDFYGIKWEVIFGSGRGQVENHQHAIETTKTVWLWRVDDDSFPSPNALENLLSCDDEKVGAVGGLILDPNMLQKLPRGLTPTIENLSSNVQWFLHDRLDTIEAEHLHCSFLYKKAAASHGYCLQLSPAGHREETIFTYEMYRNGWKILINPKAITWHVKQSKGGIRAHNEHPEYWELDERIFQEKVRKEWKVKIKEQKLIILDNGKGDHIMFKSVLPKIKERFKDKELVIAASYPEILEDEGIKLISIAESVEICKKDRLNFEDFNIYKFCVDRRWNRHLSEAFLEMYQ